MDQIYWSEAMVMAAWFCVYPNIGDAMAHPTTYSSTQEGTNTYVNSHVCVYVQQVQFL